MSANTSDQQPSARSHKCPRCGSAMKFISAAPHEQYTNLRVETYECDTCGEATSAVVRTA